MSDVTVISLTNLRNEVVMAPDTTDHGRTAPDGWRRCRPDPTLSCSPHWEAALMRDPLCRRKACRSNALSVCGHREFTRRLSGM